MKNRQAKISRYQPEPKTEVDNDKLMVDKSSEINNCLIIYLKE